MLRGELTAEEVVECARAAVESVNPDLNALTSPLLDEPQEYDADGCLAGVPLLVKDSSPFARGMPFSLGSRAIRGAVATQDHQLMTRFRSAGLATLGQTTAPELSLSFATESRRYGVTRNPWALDRGVGGSSGGAAALVAAGAVPLAHGNDGAGSLRIPAASCGVIGLKPSRGRTPRTATLSAPAQEPAVEFAVTKSVRDTAHLLDAVGLSLRGEPTWGSGRHVTAISRAPRRLQIGISTEPWNTTAVDHQVAAAAVAAAEMLEWIGHSLVPGKPRLDSEDIVEGEMLAIYAAGRAVLSAPRPVDASLLEAVSRKVLVEAQAAGAGALHAATQAQQRITAAVDRFFEVHDLLVTPTLAQLPLRHGTLDYDDPEGDVRAWLRKLFDYGPFTAVFNVSGHPAISLPLGESREGLPIGVQLVAPMGGEVLLLQVAAELEQAMPWTGRQPSIFAG
ncbi:amidase [Arthrobacter sp. CAU 1506]|nr:amidase [Arthrobacter sp. CAU 1506]